MCIVCHKALSDRRSSGAILCDTTRVNGGSNCNQVWQRMKTGQPLPWKYEQMRILNAHRRDYQALVRRIEWKLIDQVLMA